MLPDPDKLGELKPVEVLEAAARGHLGLDQRFVHALLDREDEARRAVDEFAQRDRSADRVDLAPDLIAFYRHWRTPRSLPFLIEYLKEDPENIPDEAMEALVEIGQPALEPLLALYGELDEAESGEVAFILASLQIQDGRILQILLDRLEYDLGDAAILLEAYGDIAAIPKLEQALGGLGAAELDLKSEVASVIEALREPRAERKELDSFDIWPLYPETEDLPVDLLDQDERVELFTHASAELRQAALDSFFNQDLTSGQRQKILDRAQHDENSEVRASAWKALINSTENEEVLNALLAALRNSSLPDEERGGVLIALAPEADRNEVRDAIVQHYRSTGGRAQALEAMWRSMHPSFRDYFAKHIDDGDLEVRRAAIWGIGYYGVKSELERLRKFFDDEDLRSDALFAYALALPGEVSRSRMKSVLSRVEKDAKGLSELEEELVKAALDERLLLAGKEPVFRDQED